MGEYTLHIVHPDIEARDFDLDPSQSYSIGRKDSDIDLGFEDTASRSHAKLLFDHSAPNGGAWKIVDEMSANGTWVDGKSINYSHLEAGEKFRIGKCVFTLQSSAARKPQPEPKGSGLGIARMQSLANEERAGERTRSAPHRSSTPVVPIAKQPVGAFVGVAVIAVIAIIGFVVIASSGGSSGSQGSETSTTAQNSEGVLAKSSYFRRKLFEAVGQSDPSHRLESLVALDEDSKNPDVPKDLRKEYKREILAARRELITHVANWVNPRLLKAESLVKSKLYKDAQTAIEEVRRKPESETRLWRETFENESNFQKKLTSISEALAEGNAALLREKRAEAEVSFRLGWTDDAADVYSYILEKLILSREEVRLFKSQLAEAKAKPDRGLLSNRRNSKAREKSTSVAANSGNPSASVSKENDTNAEEKVAEPEPSALDALFPQGPRSEAEKVKAMIAAARNAIDTKALGEEPRIKIAGKNHIILGANPAGIAVKRRSDGEESIVFWPDLEHGAYDKILEKSHSRTVDALVGLSLITVQQKDDERASYLFAEIAGLDPSLKEALDEWYAEIKGIDIPNGGFVIFRARFVTPEEQQNVLVKEACEDALKTFKKGLLSKSERRQKEAADAFETLAAHRELVAQQVSEILEKERQDLFDRATSATGLKKKTSALKELKTELNKRREFALELIFDTQKWPYPYGPNNAEVTAEVTKRVAAVREVWEQPLKVSGKTDSKSAKIMEELRFVIGLLERIDPDKEYHETTLEEDLEYIESVSNKALDIKNFALDSTEKTFISRAQMIFAWNEKTQAAFADDPKAPSKEAWRQLEVTNDYRYMMGVLPLKMNFKLYWAARHHSQWCVEHNGGQISHPSPGGPRGNNPQERCQHEGYGGGTGENIHMNSGGPTPESAHSSWLSSSGHHRNILNRAWTVMGNGRYGNIWTQNFGAADEGDGNTESKGGDM